MPQPVLFELPPATQPTSAGHDTSLPRLHLVNWTQVLLWPVDVEELVHEKHRASAVWAYIEAVRVTPLNQVIQRSSIHFGGGEFLRTPHSLLLCHLTKAGNRFNRSH